MYADRMASDHHSIDDATFGTLRDYFSEAQIVELSVNIAMLVGFGRLTAAFHLVDHLPDDYRNDSCAPFAPWSNSAMPIQR